MKLCTSCNKLKNKFDFYKNSRTTDGLHCYCKKCHNARTSSKNRDRTAYRNSPRGIAQDMIATSRRSAMNRKIPFSITIDWLEDKIAKGVCEVTGIKLVYGPGRNVFGPSLDQIKPSKGYTAENTHLVCWMYNAAKSFGTHDDVLNFAKAVINAEK